MRPRTENQHKASQTSGNGPLLVAHNDEESDVKTMLRTLHPLRGLALLAAVSLAAAPAQQPDAAAVIRMVDAAVEARVENVLGFTDIEHYAIYRGSDTQPTAQMTARDTYKKGAGKTYTILSQSGSSLVLKFGLHPLLTNEEEINKPGAVDRSWFTSANYEMKLAPGGVRRVNGRACYALSITARHKAPNMIDGTLWVDAGDGSIVQVEGVASKRPSIFAGTTHMMRQYAQIDGYSMATHARAEAGSGLFGRTVVLIDYGDYHVELRPGSSGSHR